MTETEKIDLLMRAVARGIPLERVYRLLILRTKLRQRFR